MSRSPPSAYATPMSSPLSSPQYATPPMFSMNEQTAVIDTLDQRKKILDTCILEAQRVFRNESFLKACYKIFYNHTTSNHLPAVIVNQIMDIIKNNLDFYIQVYNDVSLIQGPTSFAYTVYHFLLELKDFEILTRFLREMTVTNQEYLNAVLKLEDTIATCRYCFTEDDVTSMIAPCNCKSDMKYVHKVCLERWIDHKRESDRPTDTCEVCLGLYTIPRRNIKPDAQYLNEISNFITNYDAVIFQKVEEWKKIRSLVINYSDMLVALMGNNLI